VYVAAWLTLGCSAAPTEVTGDASTSDGDAVASTSDGGADAGPQATTASADGSDDGGSTGGAPPPPSLECGMGYAIPASTQPPGDPQAGYRALVEEGYVTCGIPYPLFGLAQSFLGSFASGAPLPGRTGKNAEVPHNWTVHTAPSGAEIVSLNCLECHVGEFNGEMIVGLGKADADYTQNLGGMLGDLPIPGIPLPGLEELTRMVQRYQIVGDDIRMLTVGTNPADRLAAVLASHRDSQTLAWSDEAHTVVPDIRLPVDTPPWWHMAKKSGLFFNGMARADHRATMMFASSLCTDDVAEAAEILTYFDDIRAFLASIDPPEYPFEIDETLAAEGAEVFARDCACCHGTYAAEAADETYPNLLLPLAVVGTDPLLAGSIDGTPFIDWFNESWYAQIGKGGELTPGNPFVGYVAPPLDAIWASAPYLHNASVPTLELLLDSPRRPTYWRRLDYDSRNYDESALGWPHESLAYGQDEATDEERKFIYDATKLGHWNTGHTFGDHLSDGERTALLEYLKTL
jgi:cytochrome c2